MSQSPFDSDKLPFFEHFFYNQNKELWPGFSDAEDNQVTEGAFTETFVARLESLRNALVNIEYEISENIKKKVLGAVLSKIGSDFVELSSADPQMPFMMLTITPGLPFPAVEFAKNIMIRDLNRIISVEKA